MILKPLEERFWAKVDRSGECWLWQSVVNNHGYGLFRRGGRAEGKTLAHRMSYEIAHGPVAKGMVIMHTCDTPACVNPDHLALGTQMENMHDKMRKGRHRYGTRDGLSHTHPPVAV